MMIQTHISLWKDSAFVYDSAHGFSPSMDAYILDSAGPRGLVLVCPGGGYQRTTPREAEPIAMQFTAADQSVPVENSLLFAQALRQYNIPFELHIYPNGGHGLSLATAETATPDKPPNPHVAGWMRYVLKYGCQTCFSTYRRKP